VTFFERLVVDLLVKMGYGGTLREAGQALLDAYGWPHDLSVEEILERLLALNLERAAMEDR
jgi:restriction endonuclease Mrr